MVLNFINPFFSKILKIFIELSEDKSIVAIFKFPKLRVKSFLKTGKVKGKLHQGEGRVLQNNGTTKLVGISMIPKTGNKVLDIFLGLPNEALAELKCEIK